MFKVNPLFKGKPELEDIRLSPLGREVTRGEAIAAAAARVAVDKATGRQSEPWVVKLASESKTQ